MGASDRRRHMRRARVAAAVIVAALYAWSPSAGAISHNRPGEAGWIAELPNTTAHVEGTIRAPSLQCDGGHVFIEVRVLGRRPTGSHSRSDSALFGGACDAGRPSLSITLVSQGQFSSKLAVAPGDVLSVTIDTGVAEHLTVSDVTSGQSVSLDSDLGLLAAKLRVDEWYAAQVGRTVFSGVSADGIALGMLPRAHGFDAPLDESPRLNVSKLNATDDGFTVRLV